MTMVDSGYIHYPRKILRPAGGSNGLSWSGLAGGTLTLDSTTDTVAWIGKSPITDTLTTVYFRTGTIAAAGGDTVDVRIETLSGGRPSTSLFATNTNASVVIADTDDNVWKTATLTAGASLTAGDDFAVVIASSTGTPTITLYAPNPSFMTNLFPLMQQNSTGTLVNPTANTGAFAMFLQFTNAGVVPVPNMLSIDGDPTLTAYNSSTNPDERAVKFQLPFKARIIGCGFALGNFAANSAMTATLWPASSSTDADALGQTTLDGDFSSNDTAADGWVNFYWAGVTIDADTDYYLGLRSDGAANISMYQVPSPSGITNSARALYLPSTFHLSTRQWTTGTAGAWSDSANLHPMAYLIIDQIDDGTGTGSGGGGGLRVIGG